MYDLEVISHYAITSHDFSVIHTQLYCFFTHFLSIFIRQIYHFCTRMTPLLVFRKRQAKSRTVLKIFRSQNLKNNTKKGFLVKFSSQKHIQHNKFITAQKLK